jgi:hypothetical protein
MRISQKCWWMYTLSFLGKNRGQFGILLSIIIYVLVVELGEASIIQPISQKHPRTISIGISVP